MNMHANENVHPYYAPSSHVDELKAQALVLPALASLRSALQDAVLLSNVMEDELKDLLGALDDCCISEKRWDDKIGEAR